MDSSRVVNGLSSLGNMFIHVTPVVRISNHEREMADQFLNDHNRRHLEVADEVVLYPGESAQDKKSDSGTSDLSDRSGVSEYASAQEDPDEIDDKKIPGLPKEAEDVSNSKYVLIVLRKGY